MTSSSTAELSPDGEPLSSDSATTAVERLYFNSWTEIECIFAGQPRQNLALLSARLHVTCVSRDTWIEVSAGSPALLARAIACCKELLRLYESDIARRALDSRDFEQTLSAFSEDRAGELQSYFSERIRVSPKKREIAPRTLNQLDYVRSIRSRDIVFGIGPAGTGKTYLAMALAVSSLLSGANDRIILTRPAVEAGENLGFLPGKLEEKINPYLRPLYDALYDMLEFSEAEALIEKNIIEVAPLAFMRGRTLNNAFIILDEAQNTSHEQMLMFLTRLGFHSKCVVCGDPSQTDLSGRVKSGLNRSVEILRDIPEIRVCRFTTDDVVRHSLVEKIIRAYETQDARPSE